MTTQISHFDVSKLYMKHMGGHQNNVETSHSFISVINVDPNEMLHSAAFHLGLHCLPKYTCMGLQYK